MNNVLDFKKFSKNKTKKAPSILEQLKVDIFENGQPDTKEHKKKYVQEVKRELRKRSVRNYRLTEKDLPFLERDTSIIFPSLKLALSASVTNELSSNSIWTIAHIKIDEQSNILTTVNFIIKLIGEHNVK